MIFQLCREFKTSPLRLREEWSLYEQRYAYEFLQLVWSKERDEQENAKKGR